MSNSILDGRWKLAYFLTWRLYSGMCKQRIRNLLRSSEIWKNHKRSEILSAKWRLNFACVRKTLEVLTSSENQGWGRMGCYFECISQVTLCPVNWEWKSYELRCKGTTSAHHIQNAESQTHKKKVIWKSFKLQLTKQWNMHRENMIIPH